MNLHFSFLFCMAISASVFAQGKMGLSQLIAIAEGKNFALAEARSKLQIAQGDVTISRSKLLPTLAVESTNKYFVPPTKWESGAGLVLKQNLFDGGLNWSTLARNRVKRDQAELDAKQARDSMALDVITAYAKCSTAKSSYDAAVQKLQTIEQQFDQVQRQFQQGLKNRRDFQLLEAELERARLNTDHLENEIFDAYRALENVVGSSDIKITPDSLVLWNGDKVLSIAKWKLSTVDFHAERDSPELRSVSLSVREKELALDQNRRQYWPIINIEGSGGYGTSDYLGHTGSNPWRDNMGWNAAVVLSVNWTLFNWGGTPAAVAQARASQLLETKRFEQMKVELNNTFLSLKEDIERSEKMVATQKRIRELENKNFDMIQKEYREGRLNYLDLISAIERKSTAEIDFQNETFAYFVSVAQLLKLKGTLYENATSL